MSPIPARSPGACAVCGNLCFSVINKYPQHHALAGQVQRVGGLIEGARRQGLLLLDGRHMTVTTCGDCQIDSTNIAGVWRSICEAYVQDLDDDYRFAKKMPPRTPEQTIRAREWARQYVMNVPVGTLYTEQWSQVK